MKLKTLFTLYTIVALLALGVIVTKAIQNSETDSSTKFKRGYKPFEKLSAGDVSIVEFKGPDKTSTIKAVDGQWVVTERENYPANLSALQSLLRSINDLTITQSIEAGESFDPRFGMDEKSSDDNTHGTVITLKKADGSEITRLKVGKDIEKGGPENPMAAFTGGGANTSGKFIRLQEDLDSIYVVNESFTDAKASPSDWLLPDFISPQGIISVTASEEGKLEEKAWTFSRPNTSSAFSLEGGLPEGKNLNESQVNLFDRLFSYSKFEDIVSAAAAEGLKDSAKERRIQIKTEDGFTYVLHLTPKKAEGTENVLLTIDVTGEFATDRTKGEKETAEEAKSADEAFATELKTKQEKLTADQGFAGRVFEVTKNTVQTLLQPKSNFLKEATPASVTEPGTATPPLPFRQ